MSIAPYPTSRAPAGVAATPDRGIGLVFGAVVSLMVAVAVIGPVAGRSVGTEPSFAVAVVAIAGCLDLISAVLLVRQFRDTGDRRSLVLSCAYVFALVVLAGYAAAFPGIVGTRPPLGDNPSTAPWLWVVWHTGFPVLLAAASAPWPRRWTAEVPAQRRPRLARRTIAGCLLLGVAVVVLVVAGDGHFPTLIRGLDLMPLRRVAGPVMVPITVVATGIALAGARRAGPQRWAAVAVTATLGDTVLTVFSDRRYSLGWYAGRSLTVVASAVVLIALLAEFSNVKRRLAEDGERLRLQLARTDELERLQHTLLDHMVDGVFMQDRDSKFLAYNQAAQAILGMNDEERAGGAALQAFRKRLLHPDGSPWLPTDVTPPQRTLSTGEPQRDQVVGLSVPGSQPTWLSVSTRPALAPDGSVDAVITCLSDITDRYSAQLADAAAAGQRRSRIVEVLDDASITMVFQPIVALDTGRIVGAEALARFPDGDRTPDMWFADAAAESLAIELEMAAIEAALERVPDLPPNAYLSVNVSPGTAVSRPFQRVLAGAPARRIIVELTEHASVEDYDDVVGALKMLRSNGVRLAVDDAGAGFASLRHILNLRPDLIKLDLALTRGIDEDPARRALASSLLAFGSEIGASIVAEGIETAGELAALKSLGIRFGQGYYLGRPAGLPVALSQAFTAPTMAAS